MVTLVPPVLVTVSDTDFLLPTVTVPKLMLVGSAPKPPGVTPVPDRGIVRDGFEALEMMLMLPLALPADDGLNKTVKTVLCPAERVTGVVIPLRVNPPLTVTWEIVTLDPPVFVKVSDSDVFLPTITLPKSILVGLAAKVPTETPAPDNGNVSVGLEAFERMVTAPVAFPPV